MSHISGTGGPSHISSTGGMSGIGDRIKAFMKKIKNFVFSSKKTVAAELQKQKPITPSTTTFRMPQTSLSPETAPLKELPNTRQSLDDEWKAVNAELKEVDAQISEGLKPGGGGVSMKSIHKQNALLQKKKILENLGNRELVAKIKAGDFDLGKSSRDEQEITRSQDHTESPPVSVEPQKIPQRDIGRISPIEKKSKITSEDLKTLGKRHEDISGKLKSLMTERRKLQNKADRSEAETAKLKEINDQIRPLTVEVKAIEEKLANG